MSGPPNRPQLNNEDINSGNDSNYNSRVSDQFEISTKQSNMLMHIKDENPIMLPNEQQQISIVLPPTINYDDVKSE